MSDSSLVDTLWVAGCLVFVFEGLMLAAMLTLAFAQIVWSIAFQWVGVTGGDNGILGVWPAAWAATPASSPSAATR